MNSATTSWVHLFSKFSPEALLFEALLICLGIAAYAAWVILRKRKQQTSEDLVPGSVVKVYLNELVLEAEQMREQLNELLKATGGAQPAQLERLTTRLRVPAASSPLMEASPSSSASQADSALLEKILSLETKMRDQSSAMETLVTEKTRIENELKLAKSAASRPTPSSSGRDPESEELRKKIQALEVKLSEYSVIEDDLANLKRLQQENAQLRIQVSQQQETAALLKEGLAPIQQPSLEGSIGAPTVSLPSLEPALTVTTSASAEPAADSAPFDQMTNELAQKVDQSIQEAAPAAPAAAATPGTEVKTEAAPEEPKKSEADLLAEFEKMING